MNVTKVPGLTYVPARVLDTVSLEIKIIDAIKSNITMTAITDRIFRFFGTLALFALLARADKSTVFDKFAALWN